MNKLIKSLTSFQVTFFHYLVFGISVDWQWKYVWLSFAGLQTYIYWNRWSSQAQVRNAYRVELKSTFTHTYLTIEEGEIVKWVRHHKDSGNAYGTTILSFNQTKKVTS